MCFSKAIVPSMFKHVASENRPLVLILQSYSQIFIVKHIDINLVELIWTTKNCEISSVSGQKFYKLRNFTNTKRKNCPTCSFFNLINRQMCMKINRKVAFLIWYSRTKKSKYCCHPPFHPPIFCRHSSKRLSPKITELDTVVTPIPVLRP